jgi:hypothetical protein
MITTLEKIVSIDSFNILIELNLDLLSLRE